MLRASFAMIVLALLSFNVAAPLSAKEDSPPEPRTKKQRETDAAAQKLLESLMPEVAKIRGLAWKKPVPVRVLDREALRDQLRLMMDKEYPADERARDDRIYKRVGVLRPGEDVTSMSIKMFGAFVAGYYDREEKTMVLVEGPLGKAQIPTLVHELVHALDDQHFDFEAMEEAYEEDPDRFFAGRCLFEGCAEAVRLRYETQHPEVARASFEYEMADSPQKQKDGKAQARVMKETPAFMITPSLLHYRAGPALVSRATQQSQTASLPETMNRLFKNPPTTQEQWLHPERWLNPDRRDLPRTIHWPEDTASSIGEGWSVFYEHPIGELDLAMLLDHLASIPADKNAVRARPLPGAYGRPIAARVHMGNFVSSFAHRAAAGWDGGHVRYLVRDDATPLMIVHAYAFDTRKDAKEATEAFRRAHGAVHGKAYREASPKSSDDEFTLSYTTPHGEGTMIQTGHELRIIDGAPDKEHLKRAIAALRRTNMEKSERDAGDGDGIPDPFKDVGYVNRRRGIGIPVPKGWQARGSDNLASPLVATVVSNDRTLAVTIHSHAMGLSQPNLARMAKVASPAAIQGEGQKINIAGNPGRLWVLHRTSNRERRFGIASDGVQTFMAVIDGQPTSMIKHSQTLRDVLEGIVCVPGY